MVETILNYSASDDFFMQEAIAEAMKAPSYGEVPVGAVIVRNGEIIARAHNLVETEKASSAHAEMVAIARAEEALGAKWLSGCTLYVTLEPCSMCAGAMILARIDRLCYGADDPKNGACGSVLDVTGNDSLNHSIEVIRGIREAECGQLLSDFFRRRREENAALKKKNQ